ncbi:MAG: diguanylate cyclase (GGDEF)-like protein [Paraglaciecola sp.]|jgi:diguanylate cyclase (GGDEF)-like protein
MYNYLSKLIPLFLVSVQAFAAEKVVLQLKWEHETQFAGYYAADWQGYYRDAGIEIEIRSIAAPDGSMVIPHQEVAYGHAQFAIGGAEILVAQDKGSQLMVLASFFQRSPLAIFSLAGTPLDDFAQISTFRIAAAEGSMARTEFEAMLKLRGFDVDELNYVDHPANVAALITNKADVIVTYEISALTQARDEGVKLNVVHQADFGLKFYGDSLYTSQVFARSKPELVERFIEASKKGWLYAINHKAELAQRISAEYPRYISLYDNRESYNLAFAELLDSFLQYPKFPLGSINRQRWYEMNETLRTFGLVDSRLNTNEFFFEKTQKEPWLSTGVIFILFLNFFVIIILSLWYKRNLALTISSTLMLILAFEYQVEFTLKREQKQLDKFNLHQQLSSVSAKLEGNLQTNISYLNAFGAYISSTPSLNYTQFSNYAREIFKKEPLLNNFAAAKDMVVNYVYPLKGNEKAIGLDYQKNNVQRQLAFQVANTGQSLVIGPVSLVQGGLAFIGRAPIYTGNGAERRLWGIISAPIQSEELYYQSGLLTSRDHINMAIKSYDLHDNPGPIFFGDPKIFEDPNRIETTIQVGGGRWSLAATPKVADASLASNIIIIRLICSLAAFFICSFIFLRFRQEKEKQKLQATINSNQQLLENVGSVARIGGWKLDADLNFVQWSKQTSLLLGERENYRPQELTDFKRKFSEKDFNLWQENITLSLNNAESFDMEFKLNSSSNIPVWLRIIATPALENSYPVVTGIMQDVSDKVESTALINHQANYDALTNLPNRLLFNDRLTIAIAKAHRQNQQLAVLFIDLDKFKPVNDNYGHQIGDRLLIEASNRIQQSLRESDTVSRFSGDEFGVILSNIKEYSGVLNICEIIHLKMQQPYQINELILHCSASIGIAIYPDDARGAESLLQNADQAMYEVKTTGRNGWHFYTSEMQRRSEYRHKLLNQLITAVANNKITPYYQPIFDLNSNKIIKCETLARWINEESNFIPAIEFIELAEESGLINKIDLLMLKKSSQAILDIKQEISPVGLTINVSPRLFHTKDRALEEWLAYIKQVCQDIEITAEITERLLTSDSEQVIKVLKKLRAMGVKIALDDFGTGYSSMSYLVKFPVDIIKIDRSFVNAIGRDKASEALIETILVMAKKLSIKVVAEGIENEEQLEFLAHNQCDYGQGYHLAKPMNEGDLKLLIGSESK